MITSCKSISCDHFSVLRVSVDPGYTTKDEAYIWTLAHQAARYKFVMWASIAHDKYCQRDVLKEVILHNSGCNSLKILSKSGKFGKALTSW